METTDDRTPHQQAAAHAEALLAEAGWGREPFSEVRREVPVPAAGGAPAARVDYLLLYEDRPLALIELWNQPARNPRAAVPKALALARRLGLKVAFICSPDQLLIVTGGGREVGETHALPGPQALVPIAHYGTLYLADAPPQATAEPPARGQPEAPSRAASHPLALPPSAGPTLLGAAWRSVGRAWDALRQLGQPAPGSPPPTETRHARPPAASTEPPAPMAEPPGPAAPPDLPDEATATRAAAPPPEQAAPPAAAEPVLLAARAPREAQAGDAFTASFAAYVASARDAALDQLRQLGEGGDREVSDRPPSGDAHWRVGAPVSVRMAGTGLTVTPPEQGFTWNGRFNTVAFDVRVDAATPPGGLALWCHVAVAGVPMAAIPLRVAVRAAGAPAGAPGPAEPAPPQPVPAPRSAFASYASADAAIVTQRLSTLARWAPGLDIFQDCLDLHPNAAFQPQLAEQIACRDVFLLFWSRRAAASQWVAWEIDTARHAKPAEAIVPMPLEDPAIARPPDWLSAEHLRDRFLLAGYALQRIHDEAAAPPPPGG